MRRKKPQQRLRNIHDINVFADWLGNKEFDNDGTLNCVLGAEGHIAVLDAVHSDGIGGHCAVTAAGVCPLCVNDGIDIKEREILKKPLLFLNNYSLLLS